VISPADVAGSAGVDVATASVLVDAYRFAVTAIAVTGATVVSPTDAVYGPSDSGERRYVQKNLGPLLEAWNDDLSFGDHVDTYAKGAFAPANLTALIHSDLDELVLQLAKVRSPDSKPEELQRTLAVWHELVDDLIDAPPADMDVMWGSVWKELERDFEQWLVDNLAGIDFYGLHLELVKRQWRAPDVTIADMLCRIVSDDEDEELVGDLVVIENKAVEANVAAVEQLLRYVDHVAAAHPGVGVHGILAAPGIGDAAREALKKYGLAGFRWGELGYLDHLWHPSPHHTIRNALDQ
jgi:hypothetical protein